MRWLLALPLFPPAISNAKIDALFKRLGLPANGLHANYVKWWRDNAK